MLLQNPAHGPEVFFRIQAVAECAPLRERHPVVFLPSLEQFWGEPCSFCCFLDRIDAFVQLSPLTLNQHRTCVISIRWWTPISTSYETKIILYKVSAFV